MHYEKYLSVKKRETLRSYIRSHEFFTKKHFFIKSKKNRLAVPLPFKGSRQLVLSNEKTLSPINVLESFFPNGPPYTIDEIMKRDIFNDLFCFVFIQPCSVGRFFF